MNAPARKTPLSTCLAVCLGLPLLLLLWGTAPGQSPAGTLVRESLYSASLEQTLSDESPDRSVIVYLPPSYATSPTKKYPVIYLLHGIIDSNEVWTRDWSQRDDDWGTLQGVMDGGIAERMFGDMIVVMPDEFTHIPPAARAFSNVLTARGIDHVFEEYNGDHRNRLWGRTGRLATEVMPYFWRLLDSQAQPDPQ